MQEDTHTKGQGAGSMGIFIAPRSWPQGLSRSVYAGEMKAAGDTSDQTLQGKYPSGTA